MTLRKKTVRFTDGELEYLNSLKREGETDRSFFLRLASGLDVSNLPRGPKATERYMVDDRLSKMFKFANDKKKVGFKYPHPRSTEET